MGVLHICKMFITVLNAHIHTSDLLFRWYLWKTASLAMSGFISAVICPPKFSWSIEGGWTKTWAKPCLFCTWLEQGLTTEHCPWGSGGLTAQCCLCEAQNNNNASVPASLPLIYGSLVVTLVLWGDKDVKTLWRRSDGLCCCLSRRRRRRVLKCHGSVLSLLLRKSHNSIWPKLTKDPHCLSFAY